MNTKKEKLEKRMSELVEEIEMLDKSYELKSSHVNDLKEERDKLSRDLASSLVASEEAKRLHKAKMRLFVITENYRELQNRHKPVTELLDEINSEICTLFCADHDLDDNILTLQRQYKTLKEECKMEVDLLKQKGEFLKKQQELVDYKPEEMIEACEIEVQKWLDIQQKLEALWVKFPQAKKKTFLEVYTDTPLASDADTSEDSME